jgi:hypothetical protein
MLHDVCTECLHSRTQCTGVLYTEKMTEGKG